MAVVNELKAKLTGPAERFDAIGTEAVIFEARAFET